MTLSQEDIRDIESSFHVLDDAKVGFIDSERVYTLWLGLGFDRTISKADLLFDDRTSFTLENVLKITSRVSAKFKIIYIMQSVTIAFLDRERELT